MASRLKKDTVPFSEAAIDELFRLWPIAKRPPAVYKQIKVKNSQQQQSE
jgi:hypothetical protein